MDDHKRGTTRPPSKVTVITREPGKTGEQTAVRRPRPTQRRRPDLNAEEERILRMRYGIAGDADLELEFEGQEFEDTRLQLALIERRALEMVAHKGGPDGPAKARASTKDKIIRKLREI